MADVTPPPLQGPTAKEKKYDRQLRLWAANGQAALENANVLLVNSGPGVSGVEALKNLVLPGIGRFTILDSSVVTEADLGVNFFLEEGDVGKSRAESCTRLLQELNPDVEGHSITEPIESFIARPDALAPYNFILVALPLPPAVAETISAHATSTAVPVFYYHCIGFYSHFSVQLPPAFPIVDTHPDPASTQDLRLLEPWPELSALVAEKTQGIDQMDEESHGHIPWVVILLHFLATWRDTHDGKVPQNYKEKSEFRELVRGAMRTNTAEGSEENFEEATGAVLKSLNPHTPSSAVKEVFAAEECRNLIAESADFWIIAHAVSRFYEKNGVLPLSGSLPDMKAKSADYIQLQGLYKGKARDDVAEVLQEVGLLTEKLGKNHMAEPRDVEAFCKSAGFIKLVRGRPPHIANPQASIQWADRSRFALNALSLPDSLILIYIAFLAYDSYIALHGTTEEVAQTQAEKVASIAQTLIEDLIKQGGTRPDESDYTEMIEGVERIVQELIRAGGGEMHNVAAVTGGMLAQEAIKVITKQYVPVDNTPLAHLSSNIPWAGHSTRPANDIAPRAATAGAQVSSTNDKYGVVLDAGSSGTRVHIYKWDNPLIAREKASEKELHALPEISTHKRWTKKVKPGISTFADHPSSVGPDHLKALFDHALEYIPEQDVPDTPIFLLATAGMRLLPDMQRNEILRQVCDYATRTTKFQLPDCELHVQVIPGDTEGLYGWIAANYLLNGFDNPEEHQHGNGHHTYGFLDMGGASAQIAFAPNATEAEKHANDLKLLRMRTLDGNPLEFRLFTTTWLGFGVNEARRRYIKALIDGAGAGKELPDPCLPSGLEVAQSDSHIIQSSRFIPSEPHLLGTGKFTECLSATYPLLEKDVACEDEPCLFAGSHVPAIDFEINHFVGISEYWHTTHEIFEMGHADAAYDFQTYQARVTEFCSKPWKDLQHSISLKKYGRKVDEATAAEVCFKASWLINMLHEGIGIPRVGIEASKHVADSQNATKEILDSAKQQGYLAPFQAVNKIDKTEVSWTLGKMLLLELPHVVLVLHLNHAPRLALAAHELARAGVQHARIAAARRRHVAQQDVGHLDAAVGGCGRVGDEDEARRVVGQVFGEVVERGVCVAGLLALDVQRLLVDLIWRGGAVSAGASQQGTDIRRGEGTHIFLPGACLIVKCPSETCGARLSSLVARHLSRPLPNYAHVAAAGRAPRSSSALVMTSHAAAAADERNKRMIHTAGCIIIGDEVLGGKTVDTNSAFYAKFCFNLGINLKRIEVIGDDEGEIVEAVRRMSANYDMVVTSGGIGPTHDDITYQSIAKAFDLPLVEHEGAFQKMKKLSRPHPSQPNFSWDKPSPALDAKKRMIILPIDQSRATEDQVVFVDEELWVPISVVNGNVHILPGVPRLFERLLSGLKPTILPRLTDPEGKGVYRIMFATPLAESEVAGYLTELAGRAGPKGIKVGSYPRWGKAKNTVTLVGRDKEYMESLVAEVEGNVKGRRVSREDEDDAPGGSDKDA
ncbi:hypothetical protein FH972_022372 [Carpinus fangiana]|uniref:MoaB/Mog domain-containing protein n=1 Tax=Carpinus fangiana TaxID=176857 RepID=A0A5N6KS27_9ROSI|nr:hypothetical protein FH972_022372 [Carpinus fangiana]